MPLGAESTGGEGGGEKRLLRLSDGTATDQLHKSGHRPRGSVAASCSTTGGSFLAFCNARAAIDVDIADERGRLMADATLSHCSLYRDSWSPSVLQVALPRDSGTAHG